MKTMHGGGIIAPPPGGEKLPCLSQARAHGVEYLEWPVPRNVYIC